MAMEVEILIDGLANCYDKGGFWNVAFICDNGHLINFEVDGVVHGESPIHKAGRTRSISFDIGNTPVTAPAKGPAFNTIFNMAAAYAHGPGKLNVDPTGTTNKILMKIPSATLDGGARTENKYFVQDASIPGAPPHIIDNVANVISAKFQVTDQVNGLKMIINDNVAPIEIPFPYREGPLKLKFDNDCAGCLGNDFILLYDWVKDIDGKKFHAGQIKSDSTLVFSEPRKIENFSLTILPFSSLNGNCDPATTDPPPGP